MSSEKSFLQNIKVENEKKLLSFLMRNPVEISNNVRKEFFLHPTSKIIYSALSDLYKRELEFDLDTLHTLCVEIDHFLERDLLEEIYNSYTDFTNIDFVKKVVENDYIKKQKLTEIIEDLEVAGRQKDFLSAETMRETARKLLESANTTASSGIIFLTAKELMEEHALTLSDRQRGLFKRGYGLKDIDRQLKNPAGAGDITTLVSYSGALKSFFTKTIESNLLDKGVCVVSFNFEMGKSPNADRLLVIRGNGDITFDDLFEENPSDEIKRQIDNTMGKISAIKTYLYCPNEVLTLDDLDASIDQAKNILHRAGVLPSDEYVFYTADLLSMVPGFLDNQDIERSMNNLHTINRRHRGHFLGVVQSNENKFRTGKVMKDATALDFIRVDWGDIKNGAAYKERSRYVFAINRPLYLKKLFFPRDDWSGEEDILYLDCIKSNYSDFFTAEYVWDKNKISARRRDFD